MSLTVDSVGSCIINIRHLNAFLNQYQHSHSLKALSTFFKNRSSLHSYSLQHNLKVSIAHELIFALSNGVQFKLLICGFLSYSLLPECGIHYLFSKGKWVQPLFPRQQKNKINSSPAPPKIEAEILNFPIWTILKKSYLWNNWCYKAMHVGEKRGIKNGSRLYIMKIHLAFHSASFPKQNTVSLSYRIYRVIFMTIIRAQKRNSKNSTHPAWVKVLLFQQGTQTGFYSWLSLCGISVGTSKT